MSTVTTVNVTGMTCDHCVGAVRSELEGIHGVTSVEVDLGSGVATVTSDGPLDAALLVAAVLEAGYEVEP